MRSIGFIGAGNMAGAIITKVRDILPIGNIGIYDVEADKCAYYRTYGHPVHDSIEALVAACDIIFLSVKPQAFPAILPAVKRAMTPDKLLVSIAAGIGADYLQREVGFPCKLVLVMPNTPILLGQGAAALARVEPTTTEEFEEIRHIFALSGVAEEVAPEQMNAVMSVHGTTPAYIYLFAQTIINCAEAHAIGREAAKNLFCQTLIGSARMLTESGKTPQELIDMVCSPGGTTLAGMAALREAGFTSALQGAYEASIRRAEELAK